MPRRIKPKRLAVDVVFCGFLFSSMVFQVEHDVSRRTRRRRRAVRGLIFLLCVL